MKRNRFKIILSIIIVILLIPFIAMQFSDEVNWTFFDFAVAAGLLLGTALIFELILRIVTNTKHRVIASVILFVALLLIWIELAVGVFGTPFAGS